jgi:hypothetical protein
MGKLFPDTSPEVEEVYIEMIRAMPGWKKIQMVEQLNTRMRTLVMQGLEARHPEASREYLYREWAKILIGPELVQEICNHHPDVFVNLAEASIAERK